MSDDPTGGAPLVIGLDVGTSSVKAAAFGRGGVVVASAHEPVPTSSPTTPGHHEQDPREIVLATRSALAGVVDSLARAGAQPRRVLAIGVATAMHGLLGLDRHGAPRTPLITWADGRATPEASWMRAEPALADLHAVTGTPVHPMSPLAKLRWFADHDPAAAATVTTWVGLKELVFADLTGHLAVDESSASSSGLWSIRDRAWHPAALDAARVTADALAPVLSTTDARPLTGGIATATGLREDLPVVIGAGDGPAANLGVGATEPGVAALSIGTSAALRVVTTEPTIGDGSLFCYVLDDDRFVVGGALSTGGTVLDWAAATFAAPLGTAPDHGTSTSTGTGEPAGRVPDEIIRLLVEEAAAVPPGSDGLVVVPRLLPERSPSWDPTRTATITGLTGRHGRGHIVRAAIEGVVAQLAEVLASIEATTGPVHEVRATGGAFAHPLWREITAAALGRKLHVIDDAHGTARGAAHLARTHLRGLAD